MSPSRSKAKDKRAAAGKDPVKSAAKPTTTGGGYNPLLGTFHTLDPAPVSSIPPVNGRFQDIDDNNDPSGNSVDIGADYDCVSNNGSWSGESEDPKDKPSQGPSRHEAAVSGVDSDKREKIRQKNEKKHQRQKERRAQELHERCCGYLMSRKLEALAQKLVAMGFPLERATMALIMNEGRVEESVAWLFESGEDSGDHRGNTLNTTSNLKVDISQELALIVEMENKFKCSKQEVERAIVASEGDLNLAAESLLKLQKQESQAALPKSGDTPAVGGGGKPSVPVTPITTKIQAKRTLSSGAMSVKVDDKVNLYPSMAAPAGRPVVDSGSKNIQLLKKVPPISDWAKPQQSVSIEKRWSGNGLSPSGSYLQAAPPLSKTETHFSAIGNELKNLQLGSLREPVIMMQRPQSKNIPTTSMSPSPSSSVGPSGFSRSFNTPTYGNSIGNHYDQMYQHRHLPPQHYVPTPTLAAASSLGLFSGLGSNGAPATAHVDWNGDWSSQFDYTNIDWSLNRIPSPSSLRPNGTWKASAAVRPVVANGGVDAEAAGGGEWTSPFEEKDLFSIPRKFVSSPTL